MDRKIIRATVEAYLWVSKITAVGFMFVIPTVFGLWLDFYFGVVDGTGIPIFTMLLTFIGVICGILGVMSLVNEDEDDEVEPQQIGHMRLERIAKNQTKITDLQNGYNQILPMSLSNAAKAMTSALDDIDALEDHLGQLAFQFRGAKRDEKKRRKIVKKYEVAMKKLFKIGWSGEPDVESQLPDEYMPQVYKDFWTERLQRSQADDAFDERHRPDPIQKLMFGKREEK